MMRTRPIWAANWPGCRSDPRISRMLVAAREKGASALLVIAAALSSIRASGPRKGCAADERHAIADERSISVS
jgi:hypothetical protein